MIGGDNVDGMGLYQELQSKISLLDVAVKELRGRGTAYAQAERDYKVALAKEILDKRGDGMPVTIIGDVCRGQKDIAQLRFERDCAEVLYRSALEAINSIKLQIRVIENQVSREWGQARGM